LQVFIYITDIYQNHLKDW